MSLTNQLVIPLQVDLPLLAVYDMNGVRSFPECSLEENVRLTVQQDMQEIIDQLFKLPMETATACPLPPALPDKTKGHKGAMLRLPRQKPIPAARQPTRWEQFAKTKGIKKRRKRSGMQWNDRLGSYAARHGAKSAKNQIKQQEDWCQEVDD
mgnify:FL=1